VQPGPVLAVFNLAAFSVADADPLPRVCVCVAAGPAAPAARPRPCSVRPSPTRAWRWAQPRAGQQQRPSTRPSSSSSWGPRARAARCAVRLAVPLSARAHRHTLTHKGCAVAVCHMPALRCPSCPSPPPPAGHLRADRLGVCALPGGHSSRGGDAGAARGAAGDAAAAGADGAQVRARDAALPAAARQQVRRRVHRHHVGSLCGLLPATECCLHHVCRRSAPRTRTQVRWALV
jgi:hypothetical protein